MATVSSAVVRRICLLMSPRIVAAPEHGPQTVIAHREAGKRMGGTGPGPPDLGRASDDQDPDEPGDGPGPPPAQAPRPGAAVRAGLRNGARLLSRRRRAGVHRRPAPG